MTPLSDVNDPKPAHTTACCDSRTLSTCCAAEDKVPCCGATTPPVRCGCGAGHAATVCSTVPGRG